MDIGYATSSLARFSTGSREGHLARVLRIEGHLKKRPNFEIVHDLTETHQRNNDRMANRRELMVHCSGSLEETYSGLTIRKFKALSIPTCCDADLAHDRVTRRSIGGVVSMVGNTIVVHKSKRHTSIETSTYGAELNAGRAGVEHCQETRHMLRSLGVEVNLPSK